MLLKGCDFHSRFQQIAMLDSQTGEPRSCFGGSLLLQQEELNFSSAKKHAIVEWALAPGLPGQR
jgi:hypothetical protein